VKQVPSKTFAVAGLHCIDCAERVQATVSRVDGVSDCQVDYAAGTLTVSVTMPDLTEQIANAVSSAGYALVTDRRREPRPAGGFVRFIFSERETALVALAGLMILVGLLLGVVGARSWAGTAFFVAAIVVSGVPVARHAYQELWFSHSLGINVLMVIAVIGAGFIGEWAEAAIVVVLFSLGEALEEYASEQARGALDSLLDLAPLVALRIQDSGKTEEVAVERLAIGDQVLVRPGDRVSVDGVIRGGQSAVDQAAITGESVPVDKGPGDEVYAGTVNTSGALEVEVTHLAEDNTLSRMVHLVQEAQSRRAPVQRFIDRFARVYTPAVAVTATLVAVLPPLVFGQPFLGEQGWLMRALQMLVIACPCALVISTPVSLVSAMTNAASRGVLIKGGRYLETLSRAKVFAFDKTGTLTEGRPAVTDVVDVCTCGKCPENCGLQHAAALEVQSSHPLARALVEEAQARKVMVPHALEVAVLSGRGVEGTVNGQQVTVASHAHFDEHLPHSEGVCQEANDLAAQGKTVMLVCHGEEVCALFGVADVPRASSRRALTALKAGWDIHTVMLTGDNPSVAAAIAHQVGVDEVIAELLPEEKVAAVAELQEKYKDPAETSSSSVERLSRDDVGEPIRTDLGELSRTIVVMVGDGINDAPALAQADVGIAMGGAGSDQAMETADVVLMGDDLTQLPFIVWLSRKTRDTVTMNIIFALAVKALVFGLAATGLASLWMAIVADVGASIAVILNGMRLRRMKAS